MSVAVLTFQSRSRDTNDVFLAEGLADDIAARLGQVARITVRSREAVRRLPDAERMSMPELGRKLNATYVLSGTVQPSGDRLRIIVELTKAQSSDVAWTSPFDRTRDDILAMQSDIASAVAGAVAGRLGAVDSRKVAAAPTTNAEAFARLIRGTAFMSRRLQVYAVPDLREAVRLDPASALAWARLGQSLALCANSRCGVDSVSLLRLQARVAADRALALDTLVADAWLADGLALSNAERPDYPAAQISIERAVRLDPRNAEAWHILGFRLLHLGENSAADRAYRRALEIDPGRAITWAHLAYKARDEGRWQDQEAYADTALALQKGFPPGQSEKWYAVLQQGNPIAIRGLGARLGLSDATTAMYEEAYARLAERDTAGVNVMLDSLRSLPGTPRVDLAVLFARVGRRADATEQVRSWSEPSISTWHELRSPHFDAVRSFPEFVAYVARARELMFWTARPR